jgi:CHAT domain-containing protein
LVEQCLAKFKPSPLFVEEAKQVAKIVKASATIESCNSIAKLAEQSDVDICHSCCHGRFNPALPLQSGIWLTRDGQAQLQALISFEKSQIARQWLFLNACDTGRSAASEDEENLGLASNLPIPIYWACYAIFGYGRA